jgi:hypothetical protein
MVKATEKLEAPSVAKPTNMAEAPAAVPVKPRIVAGSPTLITSTRSLAQALGLSSRREWPSPE